MKSCSKTACLHAVRHIFSLRFLSNTRMFFLFVCILVSLQEEEKTNNLSKKGNLFPFKNIVAVFVNDYGKMIAVMENVVPCSSLLFFLTCHIFIATLRHHLSFDLIVFCVFIRHGLVLATASGNSNCFTDNKLHTVVTCLPNCE